MDVSIDMIHPVKWDEMMMTGMRAGIALGELDAIRSFDAVDGSDVLAIGGFDFHMLFDLVRLCHNGLLGCAP
jgi:hypothetical protein